MKIAFFAYVVFVGVLAFLILFVADRHMNAGVERLSKYRLPPHSALEFKQSAARAPSATTIEADATAPQLNLPIGIRVAAGESTRMNRHVSDIA